jgi:hypothetical protein
MPLRFLFGSPLTTKACQACFNFPQSMEASILFEKVCDLSKINNKKKIKVMFGTKDDHFIKKINNFC